jgi:hypothetical protein
MKNYAQVFNALGHSMKMASKKRGTVKINFEK